jgi:hypothetical protein
VVQAVVPQESRTWLNYPIKSTQFKWQLSFRRAVDSVDEFDADAMTGPTDPNYPNIPPSNVANVTNGYNAQKKGTVCKVK